MHPLGIIVPQGLQSNPPPCTEPPQVSPRVLKIRNNSVWPKHAPAELQNTTPAKGKTKALITVTKTTGIIVGAMPFNENVCHGHRLPDVLEHCWAVTGHLSVRGYLRPRIQGAITGRGRAPPHPQTSEEERHAVSALQGQALLPPPSGYRTGDRPSQARPPHDPELPQGRCRRHH